MGQGQDTEHVGGPSPFKPITLMPKPETEYREAKWEVSHQAIKIDDALPQLQEAAFWAFFSV